LINQEVLYKVLLPAWIWEKAQSKEELKALVLQYMKRYPHYHVRGIQNRKAICDRKEEEI
jgi:hypothetical protein